MGIGVTMARRGGGAKMECRVCVASARAASADDDGAALDEKRQLDASSTPADDEPPSRASSRTKAAATLPNLRVHQRAVGSRAAAQMLLRNLRGTIVWRGNDSYPLRYERDV